MIVIKTDRLILRTWEDKDINDYYQINQDPKVIELLRGSLTIQEVKDFISSANQQFEKLKFTLWAVEEKATGKLLGFTGLNMIEWDAPFSPKLEIGWRLGSEFWGKGFATEAARGALDYGFNTLGLKEVVAFTVPMNHRSIRVMEKLGMTRDVSGDFRHTKIHPDHPLSQHILFRIKQKDFIN